jgi:hypothetical protein
MGVAVAWIMAGLYALVELRVGWRLVPGVVFCGVGMLYLRGALTSLARRADDR